MSVGRPYNVFNLFFTHKYYFCWSTPWVTEKENYNFAFRLKSILSKKKIVESDK